MIFPTTLSLVLALAPVTVFAAPTQTVDSIAALIPRQDLTELPAVVYEELRKTDSLCDLSNVALPAGMCLSKSFHQRMTNRC